MSNLKMKEPSVVFYVFDEFNEFLELKTLELSTSSELLDNESCASSGGNCPKKFAAFFKVDGYFLSIFIRLLNESPVYSSMVRKQFLRYLNHSSDVTKINAKFQLIQPKAEVLDYGWNDRVCRLVFQRQELERAMSWLSTLGGAFSALGDSFENCAKTAGKISIQQLKIALQLGEPLLAARCKLYMALSFIQLGKLGLAKSIVQKQFQIAKAHNDIKLENMCKGIWAKLQYIYKQKKINFKRQDFLNFYLS